MLDITNEAEIAPDPRGTSGPPPTPDTPLHHNN